MEQWTIKKLLDWMTSFFTEKGIDAPRLSAELLLSHVLSCQRIELYTTFDKIVDPTKLHELRALVKRCAEHEPVAYLVGRCEFYSMQIKVNSSCLIPRPETELLVERGIDFLRRREGEQVVLDLCTGSGCIAIAIAKNFPGCHVTATDISDEALSIADENIKAHNLVDRIRLMSGDLFDPIIEGLDEAKFDLIVCNPPYVTTAEMETLDKNVKDYEPHSALHAGPKGLDIYRRIFAQVDTFLKPNAALILEIGYAQGKTVRQLLEETTTFEQIAVEKDRSDNDRIVTASKTLA